MGVVRVGTCSWTEKTMVKLWYPPGVTSAEARLRYYADRFDTVEVDSTFYALPDPDRAAAWAERTPAWFTFHVKAFGLMTGHSVDPRALESPLSGMGYSLSRHGRAKDPSPALRQAVFERFRDGVEPLRAAGKLGAVLLQFPPWFRGSGPDRDRNVEYLRHAREALAGYRVFAEFRESGWVAPETLTETLALLRGLDMAYVCVDAPRMDDPSVMPPLAEATSDWACVRLHGRNALTWASAAGSAADRFDYLYSDDELREWERPIRRLAGQVDQTHVLFNNNKYDYAQRNAHRMNEILADTLLPVPHTPAAEPPPEQTSLF